MKIAYIIKAALVTPFFILVTALVVGFIQTLAGCNDHRVPTPAAYTPTAEDIRIEKARYRAENGEFQPNLTAEQEKEVRLIVVKMQAEARQ